MQHIEVRRRLHAPIDETWAILMDHAGWTRWAGFGRVSMERSGAPDPNGTGAIRVLPGGGREEVLSLGPGYHMTYTVLSGIPIKDHLGEVSFADAGNGAIDATWRCRFNSKIPGLGWAMRLGVTQIFRRTLGRLEREAQRRTRG